jgi:diguanylate cyclase (GGDEF)-like protein
MRAVSIKAKLAMGALVISLLVAFVAVFAVRQQLDTSEAAARIEAENVATALAYSSIAEVLNKNKKPLQNYVDGLHRIYHRDITVVDLKKLRIADSDVGDVGNAYQHDEDDEVGQTLKDGLPRHFTEVSPLFPAGTRQIVVPIRGEQAKGNSPIIGSVIMEYTPIYDELLGIAKARIRLIVAAAAVCVVLALLAGLAIATRITKPLTALTRAAADFASGKFDTKVETGRRDEIGVLAGAFNDMAVELKDSQNKLRSYGRDLESKIAERTAELSERNREITLFSKINDFLQASDTEADAYSVVSKTATQLFPGDSGALFVISASRNMAEANAEWGPIPPTNVVFTPNDCWALRRGQVHLALRSEVRCRHVADDGRMYLCLPLVAQGETLGILHVSDGGPAGDGAGEERMKEKLRLAKSFAENIGLAIANLKLRDAMRSLSIRDPLTGLFNRRYIEEVLAQEMFRAKRQATQLAVMMLDIDHFKRFNDTFGHDGGDAVLRELGTYLKNQVRGSDVVCRFGGEEFLLLLSPTTMEGARMRAEQLREGIRNMSVRHGRMNLGPITVSLGMAVFPDHASEVEALVKAADIALYQAKQGGRDRVVVFAGKNDQTTS